MPTVNFTLLNHLSKTFNLFMNRTTLIMLYVVACSYGAPKGTMWWKKYGVGGNFFAHLLRSLTKLLCSSKKLCILVQRYLHSLTKPVEFGQTLPVYFTACSGSYCLKKYSQCLFQGMVLLFINKIYYIAYRKADKPRILTERTSAFSSHKSH